MHWWKPNRRMRPRLARHASACGCDARLSYPHRGREYPPELSEAGNAIVEAVGVIIVLVVPLLLFALAGASLLATSSATSSAAREAARSFVMAADPHLAPERAQSAARWALAEQGVKQLGNAEIICSDQPCLTPGGSVTVTVRSLAQIPFLEQEVLVEKTSTMLVDRFREQIRSG